MYCVCMGGGCVRNACECEYLFQATHIERLSNRELERQKGKGCVFVCVYICGMRADQHVNARTFNQFIIPVHFFGNLFSQSLLQILHTYALTHSYIRYFFSIFFCFNEIF